MESERTFELSRRSLLQMAGGAAASLCVPGIARGGAADSRRPPNIILLMADDLSAREIGCYGNAAATTPNLDAMARNGVQFQTCWCTPICSPTRAMIMTGRYAWRTGWWHNNMKPKPPDPKAHLARANSIFAEPLQGAGYATAVVGKWQIPGSTKEYGFDEYCLWQTSDKGPEIFEAFDGPVEGQELAGKRGAFPGRRSRYWHPAIARNDKLVPTEASDYGPDIFTDFVLDFARRKRHDPFMVYYPMCLPHLAWDFEANKGAQYLPVPDTNNPGQQLPGSLESNVRYVDHVVGRIRQGIAELGLAEDTIILFTSDNGTAGYGKGKIAAERGPRVPMIAYGPGRVRPLGKVDELVSLVDVYATLCDLAAVPIPDGYGHDGHSFAPLLRGEKYAGREYLISYYMDNRMVRDSRYIIDGNGDFWDTQGRHDESKYGRVKRLNEAQEARAARLRAELARVGRPAR